VTAVADPFGLASRAAEALAMRTGVDRHDVLVVLGSGWGPALDELGPGDVDLPVTDLPGFPAPTAVGHAGSLRSLDVGGRRVLALSGRVHLYEGHPPATVVHPVRTGIAAGCRTIVLTNACGGIRAGLAVGEPVLVSDHLNLTGLSPLTGPPPPHGPRFADMTDAWTPSLRRLAQQVDPSLQEGVYVGFHGPEYETPAEVRMARTLGGDLVGMSTVLEAIAARQLGASLLGVSLVTNLAAGLGDEPLSGDDVVAVAGQAAGGIGRLLRRTIERLPAAAS
jgi:purine-nucleoside phosphorylase